MWDTTAFTRNHRHLPEGEIERFFQWTAPALTEYLAEKTGIRVSAESVRHYLRFHGYAPRRPTWTVQHLARRDPHYASKGPAPRRSK